MLGGLGMCGGKVVHFCVCFSQIYVLWGRWSLRARGTTSQPLSEVCHLPCLSFRASDGPVWAESPAG